MGEKQWWDTDLSLAAVISKLVHKGELPTFSLVGAATVQRRQMKTKAGQNRVASRVPQTDGYHVRMGAEEKSINTSRSNLVM